MGSTLITKIRICLKSSQPFYYQGHPFLCQSSQLSPSARFMCTRDPRPNLRGRQTESRSSGRTDGQLKMKNSAVTWQKDFSGDKRDRSFSLRQKPSFPKSVFAAGTAKRAADMIQRKAPVSEDEEDVNQRARGTGFLRRMQPPDRPLSAAEWKKCKESLGNPQTFDSQMMSALFKSGAEMDTAKSLLTFVAMETGTLSYMVLLRYLTLCVHGGHNAEVFDVYDIMTGRFPTLDSGAYTLFIKSFSQTARWREAIVMLDKLKKVFTPSPRNYGDIIAGAVLHGDTTTAWALYDELIENGLTPHYETWDVLFKGVKMMTTEEEEGTEAKSQIEHQERLLEILLYMRNNQIYPNYSLASTIKTWFESLPGQKWTGSWTTVNPKGVCRCCGSELESIQLTANEYQQLKDRVMADIIQGPDIFNKTSPKELEMFRAFVERKPVFDVVIDGLNVANASKDKCPLSKMLLLVVSELASRGLTILVLGRKHMLQSTRSWHKHDMKRVQQKAHLFFTENISEDDPFLLYATLHSGGHCQFVSRDLMRDHKACLPDGSTRRLFFKWQRGHQLVVYSSNTADNRVQFQSTACYDTIVQTSGDSWHIPYDDTEDRTCHEVPQQWLCLSKKH